MDTVNYENEKTARWASEIWRDAITKHPDLAKAFHPRYNSDYIEIISHLDVLPMYGSGQKKSDKSISSLRSFLEDLGKKSEVAHGNFTVDELYSLGFSNPIRTNQKELECKFQAWLIRSLLKRDQVGYQTIIEKLEVTELSFIASEFILYKAGDEKRNRIDVVGMGSNGIYIFEVKRDDSKDDVETQVERYVKYYRPKSAFYNMLHYYSKIDAIELRNMRIIGCTVQRKEGKLVINRI